MILISKINDNVRDCIIFIMVKESHEGQVCDRGVPAWRSVRPLKEAGKKNHVLCGSPQMIGIAEPADICQGRMQMKYSTSPRERNELQSINLEGVGEPKSHLCQNLEFTLLGFSLALDLYFFAMPLSSHLQC